MVSAPTPVSCLSMCVFVSQCVSVCKHFARFIQLYARLRSLVHLCTLYIGLCVSVSLCCRHLLWIEQLFRLSVCTSACVWVFACGYSSSLLYSHPYVEFSFWQWSYFFFFSRVGFEKNAGQGQLHKFVVALLLCLVGAPVSPSERQPIKRKQVGGSCALETDDLMWV